MATGLPVPYIVMEFVDGRTVRDLLQADHRLLPERALEIIDVQSAAENRSHCRSYKCEHRPEVRNELEQSRKHGPTTEPTAHAENSSRPTTAHRRK